GNFNNTGSGTFLDNGGTITFDGGSANITCSGFPLNSVVVNTSGSKTFTASCTTNANLTVSAGNLTAPPSSTLFVNGNFTLSAGTTFTHNSGTLNFRGGTAAIACNNQTFNLVDFSFQTGVKTISSDCNLPLGANPTIPNGITLS